jgi:hypothetical protein
MALFALPKPQVITRLAGSGASDRTSDVLSAYKELSAYAKELPCRATSGPGPSATSLGEPGMSASGGEAVVPQTSAERGTPSFPR